MIAASVSRVQTALVSLPFYKKGLASATEEWIDLLLYPLASSNFNSTPLQACVSANGQTATYLIQNSRENLVAQLQALMQANGYPEVETKLLQRALSQMPDAQLEAFLQTKNTGVDQGWTLSGLFPIAKAFEMLPDGPTENALRAWCTQVGLQAAVSVGRSVGGNYTLIRTALPGDTPADNLEYYRHAAKTLKIDSLPVELLEAIAGDEPDDIELIINANKEGFVKFGIRVLAPSNRLLQATFLAFSTDKEIEYVADFMGSLGAQRANFIDFYTDAQGFGAQFCFTPAE